MPTPDSANEPYREHPSTYFVQDRSNLDEMKRLQLQDEMLTTAMGGVLSEQPDPEVFERVLDVGCGTGGWLISAARGYPSMKRLVGVDVSSTMIEYARKQAQAAKVADRVEFAVMDALRMLEFADASFDLVNQRFGASWIRTWDWAGLLEEYRRVCRPDGIIRISEADFLQECHSPALSRLYQLTASAFYQAGHSFSPSSNSVIRELAGLMQKAGLSNIHMQEGTLAFGPATKPGELFAENMKLAYRTMLPFLRKWTRVPDDYEEIYEQAMSEMQQPDFMVKWGVLTAWGTKRSS